MTDTSPDLLREAEDEIRHLIADENWVGAVEVDARHLSAWLSELERLRAWDAAVTAVTQAWGDLDQQYMRHATPEMAAALDGLARVHRGDQT